MAKGMSRNTGHPPFAETQAYVPAVLAAYNTYRQPQPLHLAAPVPSAKIYSTPREITVAVESGGVLASTPSPLRLARLLEAATFRPTRSRLEREA